MNIVQHCVNFSIFPWKAHLVHSLLLIWKGFHILHGTCSPYHIAVMSIIAQSHWNSCGCRKAVPWQNLPLSFCCLFGDSVFPPMQWTVVLCQNPQTLMELQEAIVIHLTSPRFQNSPSALQDTHLMRVTSLQRRLCAKQRCIANLLVNSVEGWHPFPSLWALTSCPWPAWFLYQPLLALHKFWPYWGHLPVFQKGWDFTTAALESLPHRLGQLCGKGPPWMQMAGENLGFY